MKPTIYISSTIYDFTDLRFSLKYVLEEFGYTVLLSEANDFRKPLEKGSYEGCLAALKDADYFLLLIGQRVGGFFDANQKISITRMEYREAYKLAQDGKLKVLTFVRKSLWDIREDRKALAKSFEELEVTSKELSDERRAKLCNHPSTFVNGLVQNRMLELRDNINRLVFHKENFKDERARLAQEFLDLPNHDIMIEIENSKLLIPFAIQDCEQNIVVLSAHILRFLGGNENALQSVKLNPLSPFSETVKALEKETPTKADVLAWLKLQS